MRGIVYGQTLEAAKEELNKIVQAYIDLGAKPIVEDSFTVFSNGDEWIAINGNDTINFLRANVIYLDLALDSNKQKEILEKNLIRPPYQGVYYFLSF